MDELVRVRLVDFFPQVIDVNVDHVRVHFEIDVPDIIEDLLP